MRDWKRYALAVLNAINTAMALIVNGNALFHLIAQHMR
jgi:hypothetical protein